LDLKTENLVHSDFYLLQFGGLFYMQKHTY